MGFFRTFGDTARIFAVVCFDPVRRFTRYCIPKPKKSIKGEIVLVTGSGHGLGRELALHMAGLGAIMVLWDINEQGNAEVAEEIRSAGHVAHVYKVDVTNKTEVEIAARRVRNEVGDVTMLFNNAGVFSGRPLLELPENVVRRCFEVNVMAHFWILQQFLPRMLEMDKGHIVATASIAGHAGGANMSDYCASKYAAVGLMECLHAELAAAKRKNIKVTTVNPVIITTGLISNVKSRFPSLIPLLDPKKTAKAIVSSVLRDQQDVFIPRRSEFFLSLMRCFSREVRYELLDYCNYGFDIDDSKESAMPLNKM